ncbi:MAG: preprotein translocase subunit SecG [Clostridia bacterium]|nr:preprotein translocase subunit SecG [Clostridia bacterium]
MEILQYIIGAIILILAVVLIVLISMQQGKRKGLENVISGHTSTNSYLNKTEAAKKGKRFEKWTIYCAVAFGVLVIALYTTVAISKNIEQSKKEESLANTSSTTVSTTVSSSTSSATSSETSAESSVEESEEASK